MHPCLTGTCELCRAECVNNPACLQVYSPGKLQADDVVYANRRLNLETLTMLNELRRANTPLVSGAQLAVVPVPLDSRLYDARLWHL